MENDVSKKRQPLDLETYRIARLPLPSGKVAPSGVVLDKVREFHPSFTQKNNQCGGKIELISPLPLGYAPPPLHQSRNGRRRHHTCASEGRNPRSRLKGVGCSAYSVAWLCSAMTRADIMMRKAVKAGVGLLAALVWAAPAAVAGA